MNRRDLQRTPDWAKPVVAAAMKLDLGKSVPRRGSVAPSEQAGPDAPYFFSFANAAAIAPIG